MTEHKRFSVLQQIRKRVVTGFLMIAPLAVTVLALKWLFTALATILAPLVKRVFGESIPVLQGAVSVFLLLACLYFIGLLGSNIAGRWVLDKVGKIVEKIPLVSAVYTSVRQVMQTFGKQDAASFERVVWVRFPTSKTFAVGFVTGEIKGVGGHRLLKIFVPTAPNPTSGFLVLVDPDDVVESGLTIEQAFQMVVSGGISSPDSVNIPGRADDAPSKRLES